MVATQPDHGSCVEFIFGLGEKLELVLVEVYEMIAQKGCQALYQ
jgi:hypothetical protein